jgi:hypothetical protein
VGTRLMRGLDRRRHGIASRTSDPRAKIPHRLPIAPAPNGAVQRLFQLVHRLAKRIGALVHRQKPTRFSSVKPPAPIDVMRITSEAT